MSYDRCLRRQKASSTCLQVCVGTSTLKYSNHGVGNRKRRRNRSATARPHGVEPAQVLGRNPAVCNGFRGYQKLGPCACLLIHVSSSAGRIGWGRGGLLQTFAKHRELLNVFLIFRPSTAVKPVSNCGSAAMAHPQAPGMRPMGMPGMPPTAPGHRGARRTCAL
jgi:hypothetical protein